MIKVQALREYLGEGKASVGGWMQIKSSEIAEILGSSGLDWVAVDLEHGSIGMNHLTNICRAIELHNTLPFVRLPKADPILARRALDLGAAGIIVPNIQMWHELDEVKKVMYYPPEGKRGVGYCRGNLYGAEFERHLDDKPFLVAMIESQLGVNNITTILDTKPDAVLIGPYDLSASFNITGQFDSHAFKEIVKHVRQSCIERKIPVGIHVVQPDLKELEERKEEGYTFLPYTIDSVVLSKHYNITDNHKSFL